MNKEEQEPSPVKVNKIKIATREGYGGAAEENIDRTAGK